MEEASIHVEKVTGLPGEGVACRVFTTKVSIADFVGTVVSCIYVVGKEAESSEVLSDVFDLSVKKLEEGEDGVLSALKQTSANVRSYLAGKDLELHFATVVFYQGAAYICRFGESVKVFVFSPPKSSELTFEVGSGRVGSGQIYLLATEAFLSLFDTSVFAKEAEVDFEEIIDGLATEISAEADQSKVGAAFAQIRGDKQAVIDEETEKEREGKEDKEGGEDTEGTLVGSEEEVAEDKTIGDEIAAEDKHEVSEGASVEERGVGSIGEEETAVPRDEGRTEMPEAFANQTDYAFGEAEQGVREEKSPKFKNPLPIILGAVGREISRLRHGDVGAVFRLRRNIVFIAVVVLLILASSVAFAIRQGNEKEKQAAFDAHMATASSKFSEGSAIVDLNRQRAREVLIDAEREVGLALELRPKDERAQKLKDDIAARLKATESNSNVNFSTFAQIGESVNSLGISGKNVVVVSVDKITVVDSGGETVDEVEGVKGAKTAQVFDSRVFASSGSGVTRVNLGGGEAVRVADGGAGEVGVFFGNVYLLFGNKIDKHVPVEGGYSGPSAYLSGSYDFGQNPSFAIDGMIWVSGGNKIYKFNRGQEETFSVSGMQGNPTFGVIYTSGEIDNLYVVDRANSALLVIGKDGVFKSAYQSPEFAKAADVLINEDEQKMYITSENKVLVAPL
ncbi:MAG: hypothetical protein NUV69_03485 [Candidatus Curtissbacteria bacterium]|nr:hypothetical protein [Candidatus Curtissbacteria bacterium]